MVCSRFHNVPLSAQFSWFSIRGVGVASLPIFVPVTWSLPFETDAVMVPGLIAEHCQMRIDRERGVAALDFDLGDDG
jgi:hypothetical protein